MKLKVFFCSIVLLFVLIVSSCKKDVLVSDTENYVSGNKLVNTFSINPTDWSISLDSISYYYPIFMATLNPALPYGTFLYSVVDSNEVNGSWVYDTIRVDTLDIQMRIKNTSEYQTLDSSYTAQLNNIQYEYTYSGYDSTIYLHAHKVGLTNQALRDSLRDTVQVQLTFRQVPSTQKIK